MISGITLPDIVAVPLTKLTGTPTPLAAIIALFMFPTAVSSYSMAKKLGGNAQFAAEQVVLTTAFSCVAVFFWVFIFKYLGLLA
jgi:predicted permease